MENAAIIDFLPDATFMIDKSGRITAWNKAMEVMSGVSSSTVLGRGNYEHSLIFYGRRRPGLIDLVLSFDAEAASAYQHLNRDGDTLTAECYATHLPGGRPSFPSRLPRCGIPGGTSPVPLRLSGTSLSISGFCSCSKRAKRGFGPVAYQSLDAQGRIRDVNAGLMELLGYSYEELIGRPFVSLWYEPRRPLFNRHFDRLRQQGSSSVETDLIRRDGTTVTVQVQSRTQIDPKGRFIRTHCILHDITGHKVVEKQIIRLNNDSTPSPYTTSMCTFSK